MGRILNRLHNLELLATTQSDNPAQIAADAINQTTVHTNNDQIGDNSEDLKYVVNRLEIIESDFDLISAKYRELNCGRYHATHQTRRRGLEEEVWRTRGTDQELKKKMGMEEHSGWLDQFENMNEEQSISGNGGPDNVDHLSDNIYGKVTVDTMNDIVDKISGEILQSDLISQIVR